MSEDLQILIETINRLVAEGADPELCISYTEMSILLEAIDALNLEFTTIMGESVVNEAIIETQYTEIVYQGFKIRAE